MQFCHFLQLVFYLESWNLTVFRVVIDCYYPTKWSRIPNKLLLHHFKCRQPTLSFASLPFTLKILGGVSVAITVFLCLHRNSGRSWVLLKIWKTFSLGVWNNVMWRGNLFTQSLSPLTAVFTVFVLCVCMVYAMRLLKLILKDNFFWQVQKKTSTCNSEKFFCP